VLKKSRNVLPNIAVVCLCGLLLALAGFSAGCKQGPLRSNEVAYVAVPQAVLRDRVSAIYNKVGTVTNGQKLEILEHQKRFVKVRTAGNQEGWDRYGVYGLVAGFILWIVIMPLFTAARIGIEFGWVQITPSTILLGTLLLYLKHR